MRRLPGSTTVPRTSPASMGGSRTGSAIPLGAPRRSREGEGRAEDQAMQPQPRGLPDQHDVADARGDARARPSRPGRGEGRAPCRSPSRGTGSGRRRRRQSLRAASARPASAVTISDTGVTARTPDRRQELSQGRDPRTGREAPGARRRPRSTGGGHAACRPDQRAAPPRGHPAQPGQRRLPRRDASAPGRTAIARANVDPAPAAPARGSVEASRGWRGDQDRGRLEGHGERRLGARAGRDRRDPRRVQGPLQEAPEVQVLDQREHEPVLERGVQAELDQQVLRGRDAGAPGLGPRGSGPTGPRIGREEAGTRRHAPVQLEDHAARGTEGHGMIRRRPRPARPPPPARAARRRSRRGPEGPRRTSVGRRPRRRAPRARAAPFRGSDAQPFARESIHGPGQRVELLHAAEEQGTVASPPGARRASSGHVGRLEGAGQQPGESLGSGLVGQDRAAFGGVSGRGRVAAHGATRAAAARAGREPARHEARH